MFSLNFVTFAYYDASYGHLRDSLLVNLTRMLVKVLICSYGKRTKL